jgi:hypothetical protein
MAYQPKNPPAGADLEVLKGWMLAELRGVAALLLEGEFDVIQFEPLDSPPDRPRVGMVFYGKTNVGVTGAEGLRQYTSTGWAII